ncbi:MAG: aspartate carbamoyltransferase, partial [Candidatus Nanopelagicaceae bacterium]
MSQHLLSISDLNRESALHLLDTAANLARATETTV